MEFSEGDGYDLHCRNAAVEQASRVSWPKTLLSDGQTSTGRAPRHANCGRAVVQTPEGLLAWEREAPVTGVEARGRGHSRDGIKARASTAVSTPPVIP